MGGASALAQPDYYSSRPPATATIEAMRRRFLKWNFAADHVAHDTLKISQAD
ncbi:hypothetical protein PMN64_01845 [Bradyrhizobium sp. UFLA01-814]|uniref:hypothetical protein n=1 Tax=Bradyrhizobium sp. UFLA01-814 TaxID=3023480 RepID=UPI00398B0F57